MIFNFASRIVSHILLPRLTNIIHLLHSSDNQEYAYSPIMNYRGSISYDYSFGFKTPLKDIYLLLETHPQSEKIPEIQNLLQDSFNVIRQTFLILFKKSITFNKETPDIDITYKIIDISYNAQSSFIRIYISHNFFKLFLKKIDDISDAINIEKNIITFFKNPQWIIPDLPYVLTSLDKVELSKLINNLQRQKKLSPYQIYLITQAYPEHALKIKNVISKNTQKDVLEFNKMHNSQRLQIEKRDLHGGIYSVKEAIYFHLINEKVITYSGILQEIFKIFRAIMNFELLLKHSFPHWIKIIEEEKLFYKVLSSVSEETISAIIFTEGEYFLKTIEKYVTQRKITDIMSLLNNYTSSNELLEHKVNFIRIFKKLKIELNYSNQHNVDYLLGAIASPQMFYYILYEVGWFTLSTALKDMRKRTVNYVLTNVPDQVRYLIEDVLKGVINPNIIHDEMQINKAKRTCLRKIVSLYEDGIIDFD